MIQIKLMINGREETYTAAGVTLRASLKAYDLYREYTLADGDYNKELLDKCLDFVVLIFGNAFSRAQLMDGYKGSAFSLYPAIMSAVIAYVHEQTVNFPEPAKTPDTTQTIAS